MEHDPQFHSLSPGLHKGLLFLTVLRRRLGTARTLEFVWTNLSITDIEDDEVALLVQKIADDVKNLCMRLGSLNNGGDIVQKSRVGHPLLGGQRPLSSHSPFYSRQDCLRSKGWSLCAASR